MDQSAYVHDAMTRRGLRSGTVRARDEESAEVSGDGKESSSTEAEESGLNLVFSFKRQFDSY